MAQNIKQLSRLMKLSWDIQRQKRNDRSKALRAAWAILANEDITVYYLVQRYSARRSIHKDATNQMGLFSRDTVTDF
jgi:hypothetical protein